MVSVMVVSALIIASPGIGFGVGEKLGEYLLAPSFFTVRIPIGESFVIAPDIDLGYYHQEEDADSAMEYEYTYGVGCNLYRALWKRERTELQGIIGAGFEISKGADEYYVSSADTLYHLKWTTSSHIYSIAYGLGMEQFLTDNLSFWIGSLSYFTMRGRKGEHKVDGETTYLYDRSSYSLGFENTQGHIYLIWYF